MGMPHAGHYFGVVVFNLHTPAAAIALLPAPQVPVDALHGYGDPRGKSREGGHQAFAVRLSGGLESQH